MGTCQITIKASNYTYPHTQTTIGTITATQTLPTTSYSKYEIIQLLSEIMQPLFEIIQSLFEIIQPLFDIIQPLSEILQPLPEIM